MDGNKLSPFDIIKSINKKNHLDKFEYEEYYTPWIINLSYSMSRKTIFLAEAMNMDLPVEWQYEFYFNAVPKNTYCEWLKKTSDDSIHYVENIMKYFNISKQKAKRLLKYLSDEEVNKIMTYYKELELRYE